LGFITCIAVPSARELNATSLSWLSDLHRVHCAVEGIQIYTVGIACEKIPRAAQGGKNII